MKRRGRLRHRSLRNSRPWENLALRGNYAANATGCELCGCSDFQIHHICSAGQRWDLLSNLIAACFECHEDCHRNPIIGRLRCWERKMEKGELDEAEVDQALRMSVRGWLDTDKVRAACEDAGERWVDLRLWLAESLDFRKAGEE